jgi:hypothetical protein
MDFDARGVNTLSGRGGEFRTGSVARDKSNFMSHALISLRIHSGAPGDRLLGRNLAGCPENERFSDETNWAN